MSDPCTCATFERSDGSVWTMLRDPKCSLHGDQVREEFDISSYEVGDETHFGDLDEGETP